MKLVFYSGGCHNLNEELDAEAVRLLKEHSSNPRLTYIPSDSRKKKHYFEEFKRYWRKYGIRRIEPFAADDHYTPKDLRHALSADGVFLSGGNTYYFTKSLRDRGFFSRLREYARKGGVLLGLSAGAIIMTPSITTASIPSDDPDENYVELANWKSLALVKFEFSPHYTRRKRVALELMRYSKKFRGPIYSAPDGGGIVVNGHRTVFVGRVACFFQGHQMPTK
ncbi:MAG: Type 1 glutamine amidotransferase-like domain-containing protein [Bdellovibrionales bacterium]|nr:Type 1 glutamine amidotransferase-like domain-containing protein [Bdellovibrionales bacterium]